MTRAKKKISVSSSRPSIGGRCRTSRSSSSAKHVITDYPLSVWAKPSTWHSPRRNRRRATQSYRNVLRTGLCLGFFPRGCSTPSSQSCSDSQSRSHPRTRGYHLSRQEKQWQKAGVSSATANLHRGSTFAFWLQ